jgi:hypothetical protein
MKMHSSKRRHYTAAISMLSVVLAIAALMAGMVGCHGGGSTVAIEIWTWNNLSDVRNNLTADYRLMRDLDQYSDGYQQLASPTANEGKGWDPIGGPGFMGMFGVLFSGTFDGNGHKISDLFINRTDRKDVGLFGLVGQGVLLKGEITNLAVLNCTVTGDMYVGGLIGASYMANTVTNCYVTGTVTGNYCVGGLIGITAYRSYVSIAHFNGNVTGNDRVGGLAGWNPGGTIINCYAQGTVTGSNWTGGLVGWSDGEVTSCYATGSVAGSNSTGGLIGLTGEPSYVSTSYFAGTVTGNDSVGGLVGWSDGAVTTCYATGSVAGGNSTGGLMGLTNGTLISCYATGSVVGDDAVGGLVGSNGAAGNVSKSYSTGSVAGNSSVGGLLGASWGTVTKSFWDIETSAQNTSAGGAGKNTTDMKDISTFLGVGWDIVHVASPTARNTGHIWNIADVTYPFLSWQPV